MLKNRCRECGAPIYTRLFRRWNSDGTVTGKFSTGIRICHIEAGEICALVDGISGRIGYPIDRIVVEGDRKAARSITSETLSAGRGLLGLMGRSWGGSPVSLNISLSISRSVGYGFPEVLEHQRGKRLVLEVKKPFCVPIVVGDLWGNFEALHMITARAEWKEEPESVIIELDKVHDGMDEEYPGRLELQKMATLSGKVEFDRCPRCDIPREVSSTINWDLERGIVTNRKTGRREVTIMVEAVNAVIAELTDELGDEIPSIIEEIEKDYVASAVPESPDYYAGGSYEELLRDLTIKGMGNPTDVAREGNRLIVRVDNPFCPPILAGKVAGYYKALEGVEPSVNWTPDVKGFTEIEVVPA